MSDPVTILCGDALEQLRTLPDDSVQCCVTSPPYWGMRDYGCEGQIGLEPTLDEFLGRLVEVFEEVRRVLRPDGVAWVNMGDSYAGDGGAGRQGTDGVMATRAVAKVRCSDKSTLRGNGHQGGGPKVNSQSVPTPAIRHTNGVKPKDKVGQPWALAFALRSVGWWLRQDIIWHKPAPMPESCKDRCTTAHEYLFLLSKSERYYWDREAMQEPVTGGAHMRTKSVAGWGSGDQPRRAVDIQRDGVHRKTVPGVPPKSAPAGSGITANGSFQAAVSGMVDTRNRRSVWTIPSRPYSEAHFATFPPDLVAPCIRASTRPGDVVLDPFGGSGTTGQVALSLARRAILIELNPEYVKLIRDRLNTTTPGLPL